MRLFLIRHGETAWNKDEVFRGRFDVELNEHGLEQARLTADALRRLELSAVYSSPLSRAYDTARLIAEPHGLSVIIEPALADIDYGIWQGMSHHQVKEQCPGVYGLWTTAPQKVRFEEGESLDDVKTRALQALKQISGRHPGQNVVAVSHRVVNKVLMCALLGLDNSHFWSLRQDTCAINVIEEDDQHGYIIHGLNDTSHIQPLAATFQSKKVAADF
jgi:broad specificity phosphatase PhoE